MSPQPNRRATGGLIDRSVSLNFSFDGKQYGGFAGDTLASALVANGVTLVGRSFKYHRPRGFLTAGSEEPNGLVELRTGARREPNTKATTVELYNGLAAMSQNRWPSLAFDIQSINNWFSPLLGAGFYYKTFMWPGFLWEKLYEPLIRRSAGLGRLSMESDPDSYEKVHAFCDVLVIGGGAAGLMAALAAGRSGARVILCDEDFRFGGRLLSERTEIDGTPCAEWAANVVAELDGLPNVTLLPSTTVFGVYDGGTYGAIEKVSDHLETPGPGQPRQRLWKIVAKRSVLAAGAIERPIVFGGNDTPGVMLASAVRTYVNRYAANPGKRAVVFTSSDDGWRTIADLAAAGIEIAAVVDPRLQVAPSLGDIAKRAHAPVFLGARLREANGGHALASLSIIGADNRERQVRADLLAVANGSNPNIGLTNHYGHRPVWNEEISAFVADVLLPGMSVAGAAAGRFALADILRTGADAGAKAAEDTGFSATMPPVPATTADPVSATPLWHVDKSRGKAFVDFQNDVTAKDVALAAQEGFRAIEHLKRYTTLGMATDQGKTSSVTGLAIMAELTGRSIPVTGVTIARPPHVPVAIGAFAGIHTGPHFKPTRLTSGHRWAEENGASFVEAGQWLRPQWFSRPGEMDWLETVNREVLAVRNGVGICDVSTLGKIDIQGPDAGILLDRVYINMFSTLAVGRARYGMMLREDGFAMDDGTTARFSETRYVMSTTTANAAKAMSHLEFARQVLWPELDVQTVSITEQWAQYAVAGPNARKLLQNLFGLAIDLSPEAFPYMGVAEFEFGGTTVRLFRLSFSGELAYEVAVPAHYGDALIRRLMAAGAEFGVTPYGTEALSVMRIEKGHVAGNELNGQTTAGDLGFGRMMSKKKDFIGRTLAARPGLVDPERPVFVGFKPVDPSRRLRAGAHFLGLGKAATTANDEGYMTSVAYSPNLGHWIGLGLIKHGPERLGERVRAYDPIRNGDVEVEICSPVFVDPEGARLQHV
ncbi:sarcosine oxidase subunit alpha family protein [Flaviflagellibacter deserti]|uniref:Sarcosine oxidase subunit alpha family protein n=1 Tax=Flaviflagellibacter deserti TaxID=2267266 RepID=A0ABV9Z1Q6_9HYPH